MTANLKLNELLKNSSHRQIKQVTDNLFDVKVTQNYTLLYNFELQEYMLHNEAIYSCNFFEVDLSTLKIVSDDINITTDDILEYEMNIEYCYLIPVAIFKVQDYKYVDPELKFINKNSIAVVEYGDDTKVVYSFNKDKVINSFKKLIETNNYYRFK